MSNTAHQREMADLSKAGLNPILTGKYGGASTPSGSATKLESPAKGLTASVQQGLARRQQLALNNSTINVNSAQADKLKADAAKTRADTVRTEKMTPDEVKNLTADLDVKKATTATQKSELIKKNLEIQQLRKKLKILGPIYDAGGAVIPKAQTIFDKLKAIKSGTKYLIGKFKRDINRNRQQYKNKAKQQSKGK